MAGMAAPQQLILGTAGHIDHGKTALVRALTGTDTDRLPEEKERGITIDIGFARLDLGEWQLGIIDVPGHERFVRNMLAGAAGVDVALLVVAADDSVMPQTREHLAILKLLGLRHGVVAVTKCDLVEPDWLDMIDEDIRALTKGTFLEGAPIVHTSAPSSGSTTGLGELRAALESVCALVAPAESPRNFPRKSPRVASLRGGGKEGGVFRLPVDRSFTVQGLGTVVTGTVWSGQLRAGEDVEWLPGGRRVRARSLQSHGREADAVSRGQRAALNLIGVHHREIQRGHELATPGYLRPTRCVTVELQVLPDCPRPVRHRSRLRLHLGTREVIATVALLEGTAVEPGASAFAQLFCAEPVVATAMQPFVLRSESPVQTIGGGRVLQPVARRISRRAANKRDLMQRLTRHASADDHARAAAAILAFGPRPWTSLELCAAADLAQDRVNEVVARLRGDQTLAELPAGPNRTLLVHADTLNELEGRVLQVLDRLHAAAPLQPAIPRPQVLGRLERAAEPAVLDAVINGLIQHGRLQGNDQAIARAAHQPMLTREEQQWRQHIVDAFARAGLTPPALNDLRRQTGASSPQLRQVLDLCVAQGVLAHLGGEWYLSAQAEAAMRQKVTAALQDGSAMTVSQIRDLLGITRKYAVPFCEYLDRIACTRRKGDVRVLAVDEGDG